MSCTKMSTGARVVVFIFITYTNSDCISISVCVRACVRVCYTCLPCSPVLKFTNQLAVQMLISVLFLLRDLVPWLSNIFA
jgi:hypothetical protein